MNIGAMIIPLLLIVLISGCTSQPEASSNKGNSVISCGSNSSCIYQSALSCTKAKGNFEQLNGDVLNVEITGNEGGKCVFIENITTNNLIEYAKNNTDDYLLDLVNKMGNSKQLCKISINEMKNMGEYDFFAALGDMNSRYCTGKLIELRKSAYNHLRGQLENLTKYMLDMAPPTCIQGTIAAFRVRNVGDNDISVNSVTIKDLDNPDNIITLAWTDQNDNPISMLKSGMTGKATATIPCTIQEMPKTCNYEVSHSDSKWKMSVPVFCSG